MKVETFADVLDWTRALHRRLGECLEHCSTYSEEELAKLLLEYLADHERALEKIVEGFAERADPKALNTWVYDYLHRQPIDPHRACDAPFARMTFDEICRSVFDLHKQVADLYRYLAGRVDIPGTRDLVESLLAMEEHETMRLAQQTNWIRDM